MPSAPSSSDSRSRTSRPARNGRKETWPTAGTLLFTGADLEEAVAAAVEELGADIDVHAARSVKQGLRGRTHVEVLVAPVDGARRGGSAAAGAGRPPLPPSERDGDRGGDPVETTLAALLASAEAEEEAYRRESLNDDVLSPAEPAEVVPFEPPQLAGNPTFAAEFAAAFPAALAAARGAEAGEDDVEAIDVTPVRSVGRRIARRSAVVPARATQSSQEDFTARVRDALRRVPEEVDEVSPTVAPHPALDLIDAATDELPVVVAPDRPRTAAPMSSNPLSHAASQPVPQAGSQPTGARQAGEQPRKPRPTPGPSATGRPASLQGRPATAAWSRTRLHALGVPEAVLAALPAEDPADDLRWLVALTDAIGVTVPEPGDSTTADVTASGTGLRGALALLRLGVSGVPPQTLTIDGRAVPATATELALAIRAGILR